MLKNITNNGFTRLVLIFVFWMAIAKLMAEMFDYKYLVDGGFDIGLLMLLTIVEFAAPALLAAIIKQNESKKFVIIGAAIRIIAFLALIYWKDCRGNDLLHSHEPHECFVLGSIQYCIFQETTRKKRVCKCSIL